jgi:hypothetical protein
MAALVLATGVVATGAASASSSAEISERNITQMFLHEDRYTN